MILLVLQYDREGASQPFVAERLRDRALVANVQLFHRTPPSFILREEPENGETQLAPCPPLHFRRLCLDYQVNRFMGCDCHIPGC